MAGIRYAAYRKKQRGGRYVWGVLRMEGRRQQFHTVGPDAPESRARAEALATRLAEMEETQRPAGHFLAWHRPGEPIPLDRAVRDRALHHGSTVGASTAARYRQFAERLALRLGDRDLTSLREEDIALFVEAEHADRRAPDPTVNACVFLNGTVLACTRARTPEGIPHLAAHPLPKLASIAKRIRRRLWAPPLDADATPAWTVEEIRRLLDTAEQSQSCTASASSSATRDAESERHSACVGVRSTSIGARFTSACACTRTSPVQSRHAQATAGFRSRSPSPTSSSRIVKCSNPTPPGCSRAPLTRLDLGTTGNSNSIGACCGEQQAFGRWERTLGGTRSSHRRWTTAGHRPAQPPTSDVASRSCCADTPTRSRGRAGHPSTSSRTIELLEESPSFFVERILGTPRGRSTGLDAAEMLSQLVGTYEGASP